MQDFGGLTLPDHDLTPADFKELARRLGRAAFVPLFLKFYERIVTGEATIEEQRRALADIGRWTGVEEDRKVDANANLPVFNFVFGVGGRMEATLVQPAPSPTLDAEELQIISDFTQTHPTPATSASPSHDETPDPAPAPPAGGGLPPAAPEVGDRARQGRRLQDHAGERSRALQPAATQAAGAPEIPHGEPKLGQAPQVDTLDSALASLDAALDGL